LKEIFSESIKSGRTTNQNNIDNEDFSDLFQNSKYIRSTFDDLDGYLELKKYLSDNNIKNVLFYLATPPESYETIIELLGNSALAHHVPGWTRIVIEKPYGQNLETAKNLEKLVHKVFEEKQIYRIDHYLGKETVQNILVLR